MIKFRQIGDFIRTEKFLRRIRRIDFMPILERYAQLGVEALAAATPVDTGLTAESWAYTIARTGDIISVTWTNSNLADMVPIVILLQYGHATESGTFVQGRDFINPALKTIFDDLANDIWGEVTKLE